MKVTLEINCEGAAFTDGDPRLEAGRLIREAALMVEAGAFARRLIDINGNTCGLVAVFMGEPEDAEPPVMEFRTPEEWDRELYPGSKIRDPDGWRGARGRPWSDPITRSEFEQRRVMSTVERVS